ncbi:MAG: helix-turn-helix domain-containing protein [Bacteroidota bacterium]
MTGEWLSLKGAAEILGVHPSTVRAWSDRGLLPVHRTQGGHRRYRRSEVEMWAEHARHPQDVAPELMIRSAIRNVRMRIADGKLEAESWYEKLDEESRAQYRQSAQLLLQGLMAYLSSDDDDAASQAHSIGYSYAARARRSHLSYVDAARAFLFFRNVLIESVVKVYREANVPSGKSWEDMLHRMHSFTDEILISLLQTFESMQNHHD